MSYHGEERRIHRVVVTQNTEYHLRRCQCIRVRDRSTGDWLDSHPAKDKCLAGAIAFEKDEARVSETPLPVEGESVCFSLPWGHLMTSPVLESFRPPLELVTKSYPVDDISDSCLAGGSVEELAADSAEAFTSQP